MIAIWGSKQSGKTTFIVSLYYEVLARQKKLSKEWKMFGVDDFSDEFILRGFNDFAQEQKFPERADPGAVLQELRFSLRRPLDHHYDDGDSVQNVFSKFSRWTKQWFGATVEEDALDLLDYAGEYFMNPTLLATDQGRKYRDVLTNCDGLLCLIDPMRTDGTQFYFPLLYRNFSMLSRLMNGEGNPGPIPVPVAICVTKADQFPLALEDPRRFLEQHMGPIDFSVFDTFCSELRFFGTSAVGRDNVQEVSPGVFVPLGPPKPENVLEPIEWLMSRGATSQ